MTRLHESHTGGGNTTIPAERVKLAFRSKALVASLAVGLVGALIGWRLGWFLDSLGRIDNPSAPGSGWAAGATSGFLACFVFCLLWFRSAEYSIGSNLGLTGALFGGGAGAISGLVTIGLLAATQPPGDQLSTLVFVGVPAIFVGGIIGLVCGYIVSAILRRFL